MAALPTAPMGLASPCPAMSGAEPCTGSNMLGKRRSGLRFALAARPRLPARALPRAARTAAGRAQDELRGHRVDQHALGLHVGVIPGDAPEHLIPQHHAVLLGIALGNAGDLWPGTGTRQAEGEAHDAFAAGLGEQRRLDGDLAART